MYRVIDRGRIGRDCMLLAVNIKNEKKINASACIDC
jgi:hypothetical protein